jgi:hypothetical protein
MARGEGGWGAWSWGQGVGGLVWGQLENFLWFPLPSWERVRVRG